MDQDKAVNKTLRDMNQFGLISKNEEGEVRSGEARLFLNALWVAGKEWRRGKPTGGGRPIVQMDRGKKIIGRFDNVLDASRKLKISKHTIYNAIYGTYMTRKGHYWKHADK